MKIMKLSSHDTTSAIDVGNQFSVKLASVAAAVHDDTAANQTGFNSLNIGGVQNSEDGRTKNGRQC